MKTGTTVKVPRYYPRFIGLKLEAALREAAHRLSTPGRRVSWRRLPREHLNEAYRGVYGEDYC